jgi:hypothetical protein
MIYVVNIEGGKTMAIVKPEDMNFSNKNIIMIISGLPGVGKTTLALSAPGAILIDADEGIARVRPEHRKDASVCKTYEELLSDIQGFAGTYKTVIIDTGGALIELLKDWAARNEPTATRKNGGFSQQGYGFVKAEFKRFSYDLRKQFNVIYLFHTLASKQDESIFYDIICEGAAKNEVWQPADLGAYMHIQNGERWLGFTPTANYNAKAAYGIKGLVKVPELSAGEPNDFLTKLFAQVKANLQSESDAIKPQREAYEAAMTCARDIIAAVEAADEIMPAAEAIKGLEHALTSEKEALAALKAHVADLGFVWDKEAKAYVKAAFDAKHSV